MCYVWGGWIGKTEGEDLILKLGKLCDAQIHGLFYCSTPQGLSKDNIVRISKKDQGIKYFQTRLDMRTFCWSCWFTFFYWNECSLERILGNDPSLCPIRGNRLGLLKYDIWLAAIETSKVP